MIAWLKSTARLVLVTYVVMSMLTQGLWAQSLGLPAKDVIPPKVNHEVVETQVDAGKPQTITANVTDNVQVESVSLYYRQIGDSEFKQLVMKQIEFSDNYAVELDAELLVEPGIEYYIRAEDTAGNTLLRGFTFEPLVLAVGAGPGGIPAESGGSSEKAGMLGGISSNKWLWIGAGVLAVGVLAASGGGGGGGGGSDDADGSLTVTTTTPVD